MIKATLLIVFLGIVQYGAAQQETELKPAGLILPRTSSGQAEEGMIRYNAATSTFEGYNGADWVSLGLGSKQRQLILTPVDFQPQNESDDFTRTITDLYYGSGPSNPQFVSSFHLPVNAKIDSITMWVTDNTNGNASLTLSRYFAAGPGGFDVHDMYPALISSGQMTGYRSFTSTIMNAISFADTPFLLHIGVVTGAGAPTFWPNIAIKLHKVIIHYTLDP